MLDRLYKDARIATMDPARSAPYGAIENCAIGVSGGRILHVGAANSAPAAKETISLGGRWATPALIDCHTHLVFGGTRAHEFEMRRKGASYEEIARAGGGIVSTVRATREASLEDLVESGVARAEMLKRTGVATIEIKSGYGLSVGDEEKMLIAAGEIGRAAKMRVKRTLLGLHALPPEYKDDRAGYVRLVCEEMIPAVKLRKLADAVDAFCEGIGFTTDETRAVFEAAKKAGLRVKLHAEQLSNMNGAMLAADPGFHRAVTAHNATAMASMLGHHGATIQADRVMLVDSGNRVLVDTAHPQDTDRNFAFPRLTGAARDSPFVAGVAVIVHEAEGKKCARSWKILPDVGSDPQFPDVSPRDARALREWDAMRKAAE